MSAVAAGPRIDTELVRRGLARSREHAVALVSAGRVRVDGRPAGKPAQRVAPLSEVRVDPDPEGRPDPCYASRAAHKLAGALEAFEPAGLSVRGRRCLDVGASTGGFTDVLLRAGATEVVCVDVGRGQLVPRLRGHPRTAVLEGRNVRSLAREDVGRPADVVVADVSFISLVLVLPALHRVAAVDGDLVLMVKPQFEVGRARVGSRGVVRSAQLRREAVHHVATTADDLGWGARGVVPSPLPGPAGNLEYFLWLRRGPGVLPAGTIDRVVEAAPGGEKVSW